MIVITHSRRKEKTTLVPMLGSPDKKLWTIILDYEMVYYFYLFTQKVGNFKTDCFIDL